MRDIKTYNQSTKYRSTTISFDLKDYIWLEQVVKDVNRKTRIFKADKSKLIRAAIALLKEKTPEEIINICQQI